MMAEGREVLCCHVLCKINYYNLLVFYVCSVQRVAAKQGFEALGERGSARRADKAAAGSSSLFCSFCHLNSALFSCTTKGNKSSSKLLIGLFFKKSERVCVNNTPSVTRKLIHLTVNNISLFNFPKRKSNGIINFTIPSAALLELTGEP